MDDKYPEILNAMRLLREVDNNLFVDACVMMLYEQNLRVYANSNATTISPIVPRYPSQVTP